MAQKAPPWIRLPFLVLALSALPAGAQSQLSEAPEKPGETEPAVAEPVGAVVDDIVVLARRREENLQEIPISITTFDETAFEERSMVDITDLSTFTPNVTIGTTFGFGFGSSELVAFIRGIGQLDTAIFADPGVGLYIDGVFLARSQGGVMDLLDVERIEVLRGPQGTLFGKNTTGGAISIVTKRPTNELVGRLSGTLGEFDRRDARASVAGPLNEKLKASLALQSTNRDGFAHSLWNGAKYNDVNRDTGRLALRWEPTSKVTVDVTGDYSRERETGGNQILLALTPTPILDFYNRAHVAAGLQPATEELWLADGFYDSYTSFPGLVNQDVYGTSVVMNWRLGGSLAVQSISSYRGSSLHNSGDLDATPLAVADSMSRVNVDQLSEELQLSGVSAGDRLRWVAGALYFRERPRARAQTDVMRDLFDALELAPGPVVSPPGAPPGLCDPGPAPPGVPCFGGAGNPANLLFFDGFGDLNDNNMATKSRALFGEATYDVSERISATFGVRYSRDDKWFHYVSTTPSGVLRADLFNQDHWADVTPRLSLSYRLKPDLLLYFTAAKGYKSGGFNGRPATRKVLDPFDPEKVWAYEAGWKSDLLERRLRLNGAAFWSDYEDIQFAASVEVNGVPVFVTQNAGRAEIRGFELELETLPAPGWNISASVGYTDSDLVEVDPRVPFSLEEGVKLPKTPEWTANTAIQYAFDLHEQGAFIARADYRYSSKIYNDLLNSETIAQRNLGLLNARLSWTPLSSRWDLSAFVTNLTDEDYIAHGSVAGAFGFHIGVTGRPREWGLTAQWRF